MFKIMPVTTGFLPVPQVQISRKMEVLGIHLNKQIHVYPPQVHMLNVN